MSKQKSLAICEACRQSQKMSPATCRLFSLLSLLFKREKEEIVSITGYGIIGPLALLKGLFCAPAGTFQGHTATEPCEKAFRKFVLDEAIQISSILAQLRKLNRIRSLYCEIELKTCGINGIWPKSLFD